MTDEVLGTPEGEPGMAEILRWLAEFFEEGVDYEERHINEELKRHHWDCATLRREIVASRLMERERGIYRRLPLPE